MAGRARVASQPLDDQRDARRRARLPAGLAVDGGERPGRPGRGQQQAVGRALQAGRQSGLLQSGSPGKQEVSGEMSELCNVYYIVVDILLLIYYYEFYHDIDYKEQLN